MVTENQRFDALARQMFNTFTKRYPVFATYIGIHKYDHLMPKESKEEYIKEIKMLRGFLKKWSSINGKKLSPDRKIDRELAIHTLKLSLFHCEVIREWESNPDAAEIIGDAIFPLFVREFPSLENRVKSIAARLEKCPKMIEQVKGRIKKPVKLWVGIAIESCDNLPIFLQEVLSFARTKKIDRKLLGKLQGNISKTLFAVENYKISLKELLPAAREEFAIGKKKFEKLIKLRELGVDADEILALGESYLKTENAKLKALALQIKTGASVKDVKKMIESKHPSSFKSALEIYRKSIKTAKKFIAKKGILTLPKREKLVVIETPAYLRHTHPFAAYFEPPKFEKSAFGIYIVTPGSSLKRHNFAAISNTSVHEAYPGHHLQLSCAATNPSLIRVLSSGTEFVEGWAHYCEEYMKDLGYDDTLETRFVQTLDMIWRAVRIIIDIKLSCGGMSFSQAVKFLVKHAGMPKEAAIAEVKRYTMTPGYQLSYLLGKHLFKKLREDVKRKMGPNFSDKFFNDTILYSGSMPIKYIRKVFEQKMKTQKMKN